MAWTDNPKSWTRLAATSSWVESGLEAMRTRSAPPAWRVRARLAVSAVTCRQAAIFSPASGLSLAKRSRMRARTGMSWSAQRMRFLPWGASLASLTSLRGWVAVAMVRVTTTNLEPAPEPLMPPTLTTARLRLRPFTPDDLDGVFAFYGDAEVARYIGHGLPRTREESRGRLDFMIRSWDEHGYGMWAVEPLAGGALLGRCGFLPLTDT